VDGPIEPDARLDSIPGPKGVVLALPGVLAELPQSVIERCDRWIASATE
jgi:hypothetical protein